MLIYDHVVVQLRQKLTKLDEWLERAIEHAKSKGFEPNLFLSSKLAPDQYPLVRQIQSACDQAKFAASRLTGKEPPKNPDSEQTIDEVRARIKSCIAYLDTFTPADFEGYEKRTISLPFFEGKSITTDNYFRQLTLPNFYFHVTTAYAILRNSGVTLGKRDFIAQLDFIQS